MSSPQPTYPCRPSCRLSTCRRCFLPLLILATLCHCRAGQPSNSTADAGDDHLAYDAIVAPDLGRRDVGALIPAVGAPCLPGQVADCGDGLTCLELPSGIGVCTIEGCRREDPQTSAKEDDCPPGSACGENSVLGGDGRKNYCFRICTPSALYNDCASRHPLLACDPRSALITGSYEVCAFAACQQNADCDPKSAIPRFRCDLATNVCFNLGQAEAKIGDPCLTTLDCGPDQYCFPETRQADGQVRMKDGYCTTVGCRHGGKWRCPDGSTCYQLGSSEAVSLCLAAGCNPAADKSQDGCRDQTIDASYDCVEVGSGTVCWDLP